MNEILMGRKYILLRTSAGIFSGWLILIASYSVMMIAAFGCFASKFATNFKSFTR